jgi:hypothetical protein
MEFKVCTEASERQSDEGTIPSDAPPRDHNAEKTPVVAPASPTQRQLASLSSTNPTLTFISTLYIYRPRAFTELSSTENHRMAEKREASPPIDDNVDVDEASPRTNPTAMRLLPPN